MLPRLITSLGIALAPLLAGAQQPSMATDTVGLITRAPTTVVAPCDGSGPTAGTYAACALRNDGLIIRQGSAGLVVARPGVLGGVALAPLLDGDSALAYARLFQHQQLRSRQYRLAAGAATVAGAILVFSHCRSDRLGACRRNDDRVVRGLTLGFVGMGLTIPSSIYARA